ncbi:hypothetical protein JCM10450v2_006371 [Rhodotorula kratochvilovae]
MSTNADLGYNPADYADYFLEPPTDEQLEALEAAQEHALDHPLNEGDVLSWDGPNLHPESLPPTDYPHNTAPEPTPNAPRPLLRHLAGPHSPAQGGRHWSLRLVGGVQTGEEQGAQVWRCAVVDEAGEERAGTVVLKLYQQSLFPLPDEYTCSKPEYDSFPWYPARHAEERESRAYSLLQDYQGRDVPICYGFYRFHLPSSENVVGVVLEDLVDAVVPFVQLAAGVPSEERPSFQQLAKLACSAFEHQRRMHNAGLVRAACYESSLSILRDRPSSVVSIGFVHVSFRDKILAIHERHVEARRRDGSFAQPGTKYFGYQRDQSALYSSLFRVFQGMGQDFARWEQLEKRRGRLSFLDVILRE